MEESIDIIGASLEQADTIHAFDEMQLHEIAQKTKFSAENELHRANALIEMPPEIFIKAVELAETVPYSASSEFAESVKGIPGGMESHPAMKLLCDWWESVRPSGEPFKPGSAVPTVRVSDDGNYWSGLFEYPPEPLADYNPGGRDMARIGDLLLVQFRAEHSSAVFDGWSTQILRPSGANDVWVSLGKDMFLSGEYDEAGLCLDALSTFRERFSAAAYSLGMIIDYVAEYDCWLEEHGEEDTEE